MRASKGANTDASEAGSLPCARLSTAEGVPHTRRVPPESEDAGFLIHQLPSIFG